VVQVQVRCRCRGVSGDFVRSVTVVERVCMSAYHWVKALPRGEIIVSYGDDSAWTDNMWREVGNVACRMFESVLYERSAFV